MKEPTMTLRQVQQTLEEQDRQLLAAYETLNGGPPNALPLSALERLREACCVRPPSLAASKPMSGIRC